MVTLTHAGGTARAGQLDDIITVLELWALPGRTGDLSRLADAGITFLLPDLVVVEFGSIERAPNGTGALFSLFQPRFGLFQVQGDHLNVSLEQMDFTF